MRDGDDALRVYLDTEVGQDPGGFRGADDTPFCLGILGDFSGRAGRGTPGEASDLGSRPLVRLTPDNVLELAGFSPELEVDLSGEGHGSVRIQFSRLEDFHPDGLLERLPLFESHRALRSQILKGSPGHPDGGEASREESVPDAIHEGPDADGRTEPSSDQDPSPAPGLLDAVLEETEAEMPGGVDPLAEDLDAFLRRVVRPHLVTPDADRDERLGALDQEITVLMAALLQDEGFRALEALWRAAVFLLSRVQVSSKLRVYLIDVSKPELRSDLLSVDEPAEWGLARLIVAPESEHGEAIRWAGLVGAYEFGNHPDDTPVLQRIGLLAESADVPWISAGHPTLAGCPSLAETPDPRDWNDPEDPLWEELRGNPEAGWIGLALPGFLLRSFYGEEGEDAGTFAFAEPPSTRRRGLYGNPAFLCAAALGRAFNESGWGFRPRGRQTVEGVAWSSPEQGGGGSVAHSLTHSAAERLSQAGLIPVLGSRHEAGVFLPRIGSIAFGAEPLRAWWSQDG